jgi:hypothetical protein
MNNRVATRFFSAALLQLCVACSVLQTEPLRPRGDDPHYTPVGFFDMHVCNWPERPLFFKSIFSSTQYQQIRDIQVLSPNGELVVQFNLTQFKTIRRPDKPEKRVYMVDIPVPENSLNGWYTAHIHTVNGHTYVARDRLEIRRMDQVGNGIAPLNDAMLAVPPLELSWTPVTGADHYLVFLRDRWNEDKLIYESPPLTSPHLVLPPAIVKPGGDYYWQVNARDRNGDREFGDFNHGSLSPFFAFSVQGAP